MTENKGKMTKTEAFIKKGGLRCLTSGAIARKIPLFLNAVFKGNNTAKFYSALRLAKARYQK